MDDAQRLMDLERRVTEIEERNRRVHIDKAWETSLFRKLAISFLTYVVIVFFLSSVKIGRPWTTAVVPAIGFFLSTFTLPIVKHWWVERQKNKVIY